MKSDYLHNNADHHILGMVRIAVFGIWFLLVWFTPVQEYAHFPAESFSTYGIYRLLFDFIPMAALEIILTSGFLITLKVILLVCCLMCAAGVRPWYPLAALTLLLIFLFDAIVRGYYGYVNHAQLSLIAATIVIILFPAADGWSIAGERIKSVTENSYRLPVVVSALLLCLPYSFIGVHRIFYGGLEIFTGDALLRYMSVQSLNYSEYGFELGLIILQSEIIAILFKAGFFVITVFEILTPLALIYRRFRLIWLAMIIPFHFLTLVTMNIFFWENLILILALLTGLPYYIRGFR